MIALPRRAAAHRLPLLTAAIAIVAIACGPAASTSPGPARSGAAPSLTAVPGGPSPVVGATIGPPTTNVTGFGAIFDSLPASFPKLPGQEPATTGAGTTSGSFAVNTTASAASQAIAAALTAQGWRVDVGSPLEDGSIVLEATGKPAADCKSEVRFTPLSGTVIMSVLYGASCPFA